MTDRNSLETWSIADAVETYGIRTWGHGYFDISSEGEVTISLACGDRRKAVSLHRIYHDIKARGLTPPVLLRFSDILDAAITDLNESFQKAIRDAGDVRESGIVASSPSLIVPPGRAAACGSRAASPRRVQA